MTQGHPSKWGAFPTSPSDRIVLATLGLIPRKYYRRARQILIPRRLVFDLERNGVRMRCRMNDNTTERKFLTTLRTEKNIRVLLSRLRSGDTFLDIGANCGLFSLIASKKVGPTGVVLSFEPIPEMVERLRFNIAANSANNIFLYPIALGDGERQETLHLHEAQMGKSSCIVVPTRKTTPITIQMRPLVDVLREANVTKVGALKIDIEGYERRVLEPFFAQAPRSLFPKSLLIETLHDGCGDLLTAKGYIKSWQDDCDALFSLPPNSSQIGG